MISIFKTFGGWALLIAILILTILNFHVWVRKQNWDWKNEGWIAVIFVGVVYPPFGLAWSTKFPIRWEAKLALVIIFLVTLCLFTLLYGVFKTTKETYEADASRDDGPPTVGETSSPPVATAIPRFRAPGPATSSMIAFALEPTPRGGGNDLDKVLDEPGTRLVGITHPEGVADVDPLGATLVDK